MTIPFFHQFFKFRKPLKRIATLTSRKAIENYPHNKNLLDQQNLNQEKSREESSEKSKEESSKTKFNQILCSSAPREVDETSTSKIEKTTREINEVQKLENKEKTKIIKTTNVISSKVDKQIFFDVIDKEKLFIKLKKLNSHGKFK